MKPIVEPLNIAYLLLLKLRDLNFIVVKLVNYKLPGMYIFVFSPIIVIATSLIKLFLVHGGEDIFAVTLG